MYFHSDPQEQLHVSVSAGSAVPVVAPEGSGAPEGSHEGPPSGSVSAPVGSLDTDEDFAGKVRPGAIWFWPSLHPEEDLSDVEFDSTEVVNEGLEPGRRAYSTLSLTTSAFGILLYAAIIKKYLSERQVSSYAPLLCFRRYESVFYDQLLYPNVEITNDRAFSHIGTLKGVPRGTITTYAPLEMHAAVREKFKNQWDLPCQVKFLYKKTKTNFANQIREKLTGRSISGYDLFRREKTQAIKARMAALQGNKNPSGFEVLTELRKDWAKTSEFTKDEFRLRAEEMRAQWREALEADKNDAPTQGRLVTTNSELTVF